MNTYTIQQAQEMVGMVIPRIEVRITKVYDRKTGKGQYGEWSLQNGEVEDSTGRMKVLFKQLPSQEHLQGKSMIFKSMEGKHGLKGVEVKKNEYKGKTTLELHVSNAALIVGNGDEEIVETVEQSPRMPQNEPVEAQEAPIRHEDRKLGIATAKNRLTQLAGLYDLCWDTVSGTKVYSDGMTMGSLPAELHKDIATTLFIQASREGLADKMPVRTLSKFYGEPSEEEGEPEHEETEIKF